MSTEANWSDFSSLDAEKAIAAVNSVLPRWVALLLVVGIAWQLARLIWLLMPGSAVNDTVITPPQQIPRSAPAAAESVDVQSIANTHLFGEADAEAIIVAPQEDHEDLAETRLSLSLKGTIASGSPDTSIAIIADARNEEKIYLIRDTVAPGATLHAIYPDRVVLNRGGALEVLRLPKDFPQGSTPSCRSGCRSSQARTA